MERFAVLFIDSQARHALVPGRFSLLFKTLKSDSGNQAGQRLAHQFSLASGVTATVRRAYDGHDFILAVYKIFGSALFPWHCETCRAVNISTIVHSRSSQSRTVSRGITTLAHSWRFLG